MKKRTLLALILTVSMLSGLLIGCETNKSVETTAPANKVEKVSNDNAKKAVTHTLNINVTADKGVVFQIKRAANLQIILAPYKIDVVLQPHYPETLLHITRTKILPCKLIAQEYSVSSYENGSSSSSIWQA